MRSLRFIYKLFLPEARFPDEKFWSKSGEPITRHRGSSSPGSIGTTAADCGVSGPIGYGLTPDERQMRCVVPIGDGTDLDWGKFLDDAKARGLNPRTNPGPSPLGHAYVLEGDYEAIEGVLERHGIDPNDCRWSEP